MAKITFSPIISDIKGKLGNSVFQGSQGGTTLRVKVKPKDKFTRLQQEARQRMEFVKTAWQNLTTDQLNSWKALADYMKKSTKFNSTRKLSAYNLFMQSNILRKMSDLNPVLLTSLFTTSIGYYTLRVGNPIDENLFLDFYVDNFTNGFRTLIYLTRPYRKTSSIADSELRYFMYIDEQEEILDIQQAYLEKFGRLPQPGEKIKIKAITIMKSDGWLSRAYTMENIVEA